MISVVTRVPYVMYPVTIPIAAMIVYGSEYFESDEKIEKVEQKSVIELREERKNNIKIKE